MIDDRKKFKINDVVEFNGEKFKITEYHNFGLNMYYGFHRVDSKESFYGMSWIPMDILERGGQLIKN